MKVVVTGGSGQLGTAVLERLVASDRFERIVSLDVVPPTVPVGDVDFRIADVRDPGLERHLEGADALVHLAFVVARRASADTMHAVNVEGSRRVFEAAARHAVRRIVYASSVAAYGVVPGHPVPIVESTPRRPTPGLTYADNKYEVEAFLDEFEAAHPDVSVARLRPGILLGRRVAHVSEGFVRRRVMPIVGSTPTPVVWDEDVADAAILALTRGARGAFNLVASDPLPAEELARLSGFRPLHVPVRAASALVRAGRALEGTLGERRVDTGWIEAGRVELVFSSERARAELGWRPRYPTSGDVAIAFGKQARASEDRRVTLFAAAVPRLGASAPAAAEGGGEGERLTIHVDVTGPGGADLTLVTGDGAPRLRRGIPRPPDAIVALSVDTLAELLSGKLDVASGVASGKLAVRGAARASDALAALVEAFLAAGRAKGVGGRVARRLSGWFEGS